MGLDIFISIIKRRHNLLKLILLTTISFLLCNRKKRAFWMNIVESKWFDSILSASLGTRYNNNSFISGHLRSWVLLPLNQAELISPPPSLHMSHSSPHRL